MFISLCLLLLIVSLSSGDEYGYLAKCPRANASVTISESSIEKHMFAVVQVHEPATETQIAYTHRRRYKIRTAAKGIGTDPVVDFSRRRTMVFMDGYIDSANLPTVRAMAGSFASMGFNTISIDALPLLTFVYPVAIRVSYEVGNIVAVLLKDLLEYGLKPEDIVLAGVSLGGQSVSAVAKSFHKLTGRKIGSIFSMDPSGPCYRDMTPGAHLSPSDADLVQVVHTGNDGFGMGEAQGHLDFYMNGGEFQNVLNTNQPWCEEFCSHFMSAIFLFTALKVFPEKFVGVKCKNVQQAREHKCYENYPYETNILGFKADAAKPGIYYIPVRGQAPLYAPDEWLVTKPVYPDIYADAFSNVDNFVLEKRSSDAIKTLESYLRNLLTQMGVAQS